MTTEARLKAAGDLLAAHGRVMVAYSGGVDSSVLLALAHRRLGRQALGVIADSPSLPRRALNAALAQAVSMGAGVEVMRTNELDDPDYVSNPLNRCYFCKAELFRRMDEWAKERGFAAIAYGENADDPADGRPGSRAAAEFSVLAPLKAAGLGKAGVREVAASWGLESADAPAQPCLSSRIPHGTPVTREALELIEVGEEILRQRGYRILRVRYETDGEGQPRARVQVGPDELKRALDEEASLREGLLAVGFDRAVVDPAGYRGVIQ